jgi:hypothetical protein
MVANSLLSYMFMNSAEFLTAMTVGYVYELAVTLIAQHFFWQMGRRQRQHLCHQWWSFPHHQKQSLDAVELQ